MDKIPYYHKQIIKNNPITTTLGDLFSSTIFNYFINQLSPEKYIHPFCTYREN